MGLATEQLSQQLLEYEKKVSMGNRIKVVSSNGDDGDVHPSLILFNTDEVSQNIVLWLSDQSIREEKGEKKGLNTCQSLLQLLILYYSSYSRVFALPLT